jgi:hypothetical protein
MSGENVEEENLNVEEEDEELEETVSVAVRAPQRSDLEEWLCTELAIAVFSTDPLQKIRHIVEAYLLLPKEQRELVEPDEERRVEIMRIYDLTLSFLGTVPLPNGLEAVPLKFPPEKGVDYWLLFSRTLWSLGEDWREALEEKRKLERENNKEGLMEWYRQYYYYFSLLLQRGAPVSMVSSVKTEFTVYAMKRCLSLLRGIYQNFISPETWMETVALLRGAKPKAGGPS